MQLSTHLQLVPKDRMGTAVTLLPLYAFSGVDRDNLITSGRQNAFTMKQELKSVRIIWVNLMFYWVNVPTDGYC